jgi:hypothetical protein
MRRMKISGRGSIAAFSRGRVRMNEKLKLFLIILENSALYYVIGVWLGLMLSLETFIYYVLPLALLAAALEGVFYKRFVFRVGGEVGENGGDLEKANVMWRTLVQEFGWLFLGIITAKTYLAEVGGHAVWGSMFC